MNTLPRRIALDGKGRLRPSLFFIIPAVFYSLSAARSPLWLDATLILDSARNAVLGVWVNYHNLFNLLGAGWLKVFGWMDPARALPLMAALFGALTVVCIYMALLELSRGPIIAPAAALAVMASHSLWWHSSIIEVYTLNTFLISVMILCFVRWEVRKDDRYIIPALGALGLGISNHMLMTLFIPAVILVYLWVRIIRKHRLGGKIFTLAFLALLVGAGLYIFVFFRDFLVNLNKGMETAAAFGHTLNRATGSEFRGYMFTDLDAHEMRFWRWNYPFLILMNFPSAILPAAFWGAWRIFSDRKITGTALFLAAGLVAQVIWSANYFIWDMFAFSLPVYLMTGFLGGYGLISLAEGTSRRWMRILAFAALPTLLIPFILYPSLARSGGKGTPVERYFSHYEVVPTVLPVWDPETYIINPWKRNFHGVADVMEPLLDSLPEGAVLLSADPTIDFPYRYYYRDVLGMREDINLQSQFLPFMNARRAASSASRIRRLLKSGQSVWFVSPAYPERAVLMALAAMEDPTTDTQAMATMDDDEFIASYGPREIRSGNLLDDGSVKLFELVGDSPSGD